MKVNYDFYNGKDEYSDGDIENKVIEFVKKYKDNYEQAFNKNSSWPVLYHLSNLRKNVVRWYPFEKNSSILEIGGGMGAITEELCNKCKKVTTIELSKRRATSIIERNKDKENLEIIVGNFNDIVLKEKYDYILLNGVLEYGALYIKSDNPYEDFINRLKELLKENGKILVAIENRVGLKYWAGANEDHTSIPFDGIRNYPENRNIRTFSKMELEDLAKKCKLNTNFYYMFPDYKFPEVIYTDKSLDKNIFVKYSPYYYTDMYMSFPEIDVFKSIFNNKQIPFFANSYFVELSKNKEPIKVDFVKFNGFRDDKHNLYTYAKDGKFYKKNIFDEGKEFLKEYYNNSIYLNKNNINTLEVKKDEEGYYTEEFFSKSLQDVILNYNDIDNLYNNIKMYDEYLKKIYEKDLNNKEVLENDIFNEYKIKISKTKKNNLHFIKKLFIDMIPQNILLDKNKEYILIDQEWVLENTPYEFLLYRGIMNTVNKINISLEDLNNILEKFGILEYIDIFDTIEAKFQKSIESNTYKVMKDYFNYKMFNDRLIEKDTKIHHLNLEIIRLNEELRKANERENEYLNENKALNTEINNMINSKSWKITKPLRDITNSVSDLKNNKKD